MSYRDRDILVHVYFAGESPEGGLMKTQQPVSDTEPRG